MGNVLEKLRGLDAPKVLALVDALGGREIVEEILGGNKFVTIDDVVRPLFSVYGIMRIENLLESEACKHSSSYRFYKPKMSSVEDYESHLAQLHSCLGIDTGWTAKGFKKQAEYLLSLIKDDYLISNITRGVCLPIVMPQIVESLDDTFDAYLDGVKKSYNGKHDEFGLSTFYNHHERSSQKGVNIHHGSYQERFIDKLKKRPIVALFFPSCLQGFSVLASRGQMRYLPPGFILSAIDTLIAIIMYPEILVSEMRLPGLSLSGFSSKNRFATFAFSTRDGNLAFGFEGELDRASSICTSSLSFFK